MQCCSLRNTNLIRFLKLGEKLIKHVDSVKYLGLTLDRRLNWREHINNKIDICKGLLLNITLKYKHTHRAKPKLMKWIYTVVIRPKLTYGSLICKMVLQNLNKLNRLACLMIAQVPRSTPQMNLEILLDIEPLDLHIKKVGLTSYMRRQTQLDACTWYTEVGKSHIQYWKNMAAPLTDMGNDDRCDELIKTGRHILI